MCLPGGDSNFAGSAEGAISRPSLHSPWESREQANHTSVSVSCSVFFSIGASLERNTGVHTPEDS